jgi:hypothetical protein
MSTQSMYIIRKLESESVIEFVHARSHDLDLLNSQDLRANVPWLEVKKMALQTSSVIAGSIILPSNLDDYNRLLTYSAVRNSSLKGDKDLLMKLVMGLNGYHLSYWAMYFKRSFWMYNSIERISQAFLIFFGMYNYGQVDKIICI